MHPVRSTADLVSEYHQRTKHHLSRYAAGPETLDWTEQPDPFREFAGSPRTVLPLSASDFTARFSDLSVAGQVPRSPFNLHSIGALLQLSFALSAWKSAGPDRWALRVNPSSGNLHPTEVYVLARSIAGLEDGVYHYVSRDHALEQRCTWARDMAEPPPQPGLWIGLTSIHWREAWKYGERAFRYCQLDLGHALAALQYSAATLGWPARLVRPLSYFELSKLLGVNRSEDFGSAEREDPEALIEILPSPAQAGAPEPNVIGWTGQANVLDRHPMYRWPVIAEAAQVTQQSRSENEHFTPEPYPALECVSSASAAQIILQRRSAQRFDRTHVISRSDFFHILDTLLVRSATPWDIWDFAPRIHLLLFVHRVSDLTPGLYLLIRNAESEAGLRNALANFAWERVAAAPPHLPLYFLQPLNAQGAARTIDCHQAIASDSCFALSMLSEFETVIEADPWRYRQLHWEAGLLGQILYLQAEAAGLRGTGIGCFFDNALLELLGLSGKRFAPLYHFTIGLPLIDTRIATTPPYPEPRL